MNIHYSVDTKSYMLLKGTIGYELLKRKYWKIFRIGIIIVLLLFFIDYGTNFNIKSTVTTPHVKEKITYTDLHLSSSLALVLSAILIYLLFLIFKGKDALLKKIGEKVTLYSGDTLTTITEDAITSKNSLAETKLKWDLIESFKLHEHYLLLKVDGADNAIVIDKKIIKEEEYDWLITFFSEMKIPKK